MRDSRVQLEELMRRIGNLPRSELSEARGQVVSMALQLARDVLVQDMPRGDIRDRIAAYQDMLDSSVKAWLEEEKL